MKISALLVYEELTSALVATDSGICMAVKSVSQSSFRYCFTLLLQLAFPSPPFLRCYDCIPTATLARVILIFISIALPSGDYAL
jgi:hypothetical protein